MGSETEFLVDNLYATSEPGEDMYAGGHSVWWTWTAPASGKLLLRVSSTNSLPENPFEGRIRPAVLVYTGPSLNQLTAVGNWSFFETAAAVFAVTGGDTYHFAWDSHFGGTRYEVSQEFFPNVPNDYVSDRIRLEGTNLNVWGSTWLATLEPNEGREGLASVWYSWVAPDSGALRLKIIGTQNEHGILVGIGESGNALWCLAPPVVVDGAGFRKGLCLRGGSGHNGLLCIYRERSNIVVSGRWFHVYLLPPRFQC